MSYPKIAFVVGHANWGKSSTLRALTGGSHHVRRIELKETRFLLRRMSNDDRPESFDKLMKRLEPSSWPYVLAALCPNFHDDKVNLESIFDSLREKGYKLFFWVIEHQFGTSETVRPTELTSLRRFGRVEVYSARSEARVRAARFRTFVEQVVLQ